MKQGSRIAATYGATEILEQYHCRFGFNPPYQSLLEGREMWVTGTGAAGEVRVVELANHPFFICALVQAAAAFRMRRALDVCRPSIRVSFPPGEPLADLAASSRA